MKDKKFHKNPANWVDVSVIPENGFYVALYKESGNSALIVAGVMYRDGEGWYEYPVAFADVMQREVVAYLPVNYGTQELKDVREHFSKD